MVTVTPWMNERQYRWNIFACWSDDVGDEMGADVSTTCATMKSRREEILLFL